jgi:hypothetical protein
MQAAITEVNRLAKANQINRRFIWLLSIITVVVAAACVVLTVVTLNQRSTDAALRQANASLRQESISSCESGNSFRSGNKEIWDDFIGLLINKKTPPATVKIANGFLAKVNSVEALHNCTTLYDNGGRG